MLMLVWFDLIWCWFGLSWLVVGCLHMCLGLFDLCCVASHLFGLIWSDLVWFDLIVIWFDFMWFDVAFDVDADFGLVLVLPDLVWIVLMLVCFILFYCFDLTWFDGIRFVLCWIGSIWIGLHLICFDFVRFGMNWLWLDFVWFVVDVGVDVDFCVLYWFGLIIFDVIWIWLMWFDLMWVCV